LVWPLHLPWRSFLLVWRGWAVLCDNPSRHAGERESGLSAVLPTG